MWRELFALFLLCGLYLLLTGTTTRSQETIAKSLSAADVDYFEVHVRPLLSSNCLRCHGDSRQENNLRLTTFEGILQGGDSGPAVVPGNPEESLLLQAIRRESFEMPPDGQLTSAVIKAVEAWIAAGAHWPKGVVLKPVRHVVQNDREWWSYQPISDPKVPEVPDEGWCRNEIDRFIYARLAELGLQPAKEEEPQKLVRRVCFAITGLPPDENVVTATVRSAGHQESEQASDRSYEALVDRLLSRAAYGENQARYWLDLVRYADSDGYRADEARPDAKQYRDFVIRSFNEDKPYDRFVTEQLAGDEVDPGSRDAVIATMFLRHWPYEWNQRDVEGQWQEILNDVTETTADAFLALGLKCARCHDHKFDPIPQEDYYRLRAFFSALLPREDFPVSDLNTRREHFAKQRIWEAASETIRQRLWEIETPALLKHATREGFDKFVPEIQSMILRRPCDRGPYEHQIASLASRQYDVHPEKLPEWLDEDVEAERQKLLKQLAKFDSIKPDPLPTQRFVVSDVGQTAPPTYMPGDSGKTPVEPGFPTVLHDGPAQIEALPVALQTTGRRSALARWIVDPANPLTARVMVNRIWQQHFGRGLVETASDFGLLGSRPTHPELLDWLTSRFIEDGWSIKKLHRRILTSSTYRQTSRRPMDEQLRALDSANTLLWRMNPRRLSGEEITDAILTASGELRDEGRAIYKPVKRNSPDELLALFDFPDRIISCDRRHRTTTSRQALMLMNGDWVQKRAAAIAAEMQALDNEQFVEGVYLRVFGRQPTAEEQTLARSFCGSYGSVATGSEPKYVDQSDGRNNAKASTELQARSAVVHALLISNEMIYVD